MPLLWNEIRHRAIAVSKDWKAETRESAERQTFWNDSFNVFGVRRRTVATFEEPVKKLSGDWGFIDLFRPGRLLVEQKSAGADLGQPAHRNEEKPCTKAKTCCPSGWSKGRSGCGWCTKK